MGTVLVAARPMMTGCPVVMSIKVSPLVAKSLYAGTPSSLGAGNISVTKYLR